MNWSSAQLANATKNAQKPAASRTKGIARTTEPPQASRVAQGQEIEPDETPAPPLGAQHYIGPFQLTVANGTHFPGRMRFVAVGPADEGLLRAVLDTMKAYCKAPAPSAAAARGVDKNQLI